MKIENNLLNKNIEFVRSSASSGDKDFASTLADTVKVEEKTATPPNKTESAGDRERAKLKKSSKEFEELFLNIMFKQMRNTIGESGLIEKSYGRTINEDMYYEQLSKDISKGQGFGMGDMLYKQMIKAYTEPEIKPVVPETTVTPVTPEVIPVVPKIEPSVVDPTVVPPVENTLETPVVVPVVPKVDKIPTVEDTGKGRIPGTRYEFF